MLSVKIAGRWLRSLGAAHGPVTVEYGLHGCEAASWSMEPGFWHPLLRGNASVQIFDGGFLTWSGKMVEPAEDGQYSAKGLWRQGETIPAVDGAYAFTPVPDTALNAAIARGDVGWALPSGGVSSVAWVAGQDLSTDPSSLTLVDLMDGYATENGLRWGVDGTGTLFLKADPTVPTWHVPHAVAGRGLTPAEDEFVTDLIGRYMAGGNVEAFVTVGSAEAAAYFGKRVRQADLMDMGPIGPTQATSMLTGMFLMSGARMGWAEGLELAPGQITTPGGGPAALSQVQSLQMIRLAGTVDTSRAGRMPASTDLVIATSKYTEGQSIVLTPLGYAPRTLSDVLKVATER